MKDDCLSMIAERFGVPIAELLKLNSAQIKDPNLIYEGNTLKLPLPSPIEPDGTRIPLTEPPVDSCEKADTCQPPKAFVDILYVPAHPRTGKQMWYAITKGAKAKIEEERSHMEAAVLVDDPETTMKNLNKLGVVSKFSAKVHEQFMLDDDAAKYRSLLLAKLVINTHTFDVNGRNPNDFLSSVAELLGISLTEFSETISERENSKEKFLYYGGKFSLLHKDKNSVDNIEFEEKVNNNLRVLVLKELDKNINILEKSAEKSAKGIIAEDGTKFIYQKELNYFTTNKQQSIASNIDQLHRHRSRSDDNLFKSSSSVCRDYVSQWPNELKDALDNMRDGYLRSTKEQENIISGQDYFLCAVALKNLNNYGIVIKEQCLTLEQLEGTSPRSQGPKSLEKLTWREDGKELDITNYDIVKVIESLYEELAGNQKDVDLTSFVNHVDRNWSYYPTRALINIIDLTVLKHKKALSQVLGVGETPIDELFRQLLWIKKVAIARLDFLKNLALKKADEGASRLIFTLDEPHVMPKQLNLLWDETKFKPKSFNKEGFINQAGFNDVQVVECCLLSDGKVFYLRGPEWYMPTTSEDTHYKKAAGHISIITENITFNDSKASSKSIVETKSLENTLEELKKKGAVVEISYLKEESAFDTAFWKDSYHYQGGRGPGNELTAYSVDAGAQLLRFSTKAETEINQSISSYHSRQDRTLDVGGSKAISAKLTALQGQLNFSFWLPLMAENKLVKEEDVDKARGWNFAIKYQDEIGHEYYYEAGEFRMCISGSVYGLAAATCQLSSKVAIGPSNIGEGFGIKGSTVGLFDPNVYNAYNLTNAKFSTIEQTPMAAEVSVSVDAFAGVEVGGKLGAAVYWVAPRSEKSNVLPSPKKLGSIDGELSAAYGVGYHAEFQLLFNGPALIVVASAGLIVGPGCSGKIAISLDASATDEFIGCLLGVLKQSHFRRLSVFGDVDENGINDNFQKLNDLMTIAAALGLSFASVLLMPSKEWGAYKIQVVSKQYAPMLAYRITVDKKKEQMKSWVSSLPPETLSNLIGALVQKQTEDQGEITAKASNYNQAQAIVQIMMWLSGDKSVEDEANQRQWKETLIAMGKLPPGKKSHKEEWSVYTKQWIKLAKFIKSNDDQRKTLSILFNDASDKLSKNMVLTRCRDFYHGGLLDGIEKPLKYNSYPISLVENPIVGEKISLLKDANIEFKESDLINTNEFIINWSIDEI